MEDFDAEIVRRAFNTERRVTVVPGNLTPESDFSRHRRRYDPWVTFTIKK